jgi:hypothetical protein
VEVIMRNNNLVVKRGVVVLIQFIIFILIVAVTATVKTAYSQDESIEVSCYKGNSEEGNYVGNVSVNSPANAGQECNSAYYNCDGKCVGCYYDQKHDKTVCYDNSGGKVTK